MRCICFVLDFKMGVFGHEVCSHSQNTEFELLETKELISMTKNKIINIRLRTRCQLNKEIITLLEKYNCSFE